MPDMATNLRTFLLADAGVSAIVGTRVHQSHVPQASEMPFIWFGRTGTEHLDCLDSAPGESVHSLAFALECVSDDLDQSQTLADAVRDALNCYEGSFGSGSVQGVFVQDQSDDYEPRSIEGDEGEFVAALQIVIYPRA